MEKNTGYGIYGNGRSMEIIKKILLTLIIIIAIYFFYKNITELEIADYEIDCPRPNITHISFYESPTESMYPTINLTSIANASEVNKDTILIKGDIIFFAVPKKLGCYYVHRINKIYFYNGLTYYQTKGDNNRFPDKNLILRDMIYYKITDII